LALQGGGSHGAFTWGALDRLLEEDIEIEGISGASAGAMNAVVMAYGYACGGREGARQSLQKFWESVSGKASSSFKPNETSENGPAPGLLELDSKTGPASSTKVFLALSRYFSPYQLNPLDINPLRDILASQIDFERLKREGKIALFIAATRVSSGTLRIFRNKQLTIDTLLASACLPSIHRAIEIDGDAYWDGGLAANPPIYPLVHQCSANDMVLVQLHPRHRPDALKKTEEIRNRLTEISFGSSFHSELRGLALAKHEAERSLFPFGRVERRLKRLKTHVIETRELMSQLSHTSRLNTHPAFIAALRDEGRNQAELWLKEKLHQLGARSFFNALPFRARHLSSGWFGSN